VRCALLGTAVVNALSLNLPISKHRLRTWAGLTATEFESRYREALSVGPEIKDLNQILLLDDVCTEGSTLRTAAQRIREANPGCQIIAATAGQMIVKAVVRDKASLVA